MNILSQPQPSEMESVKARLKATWESGDFGEVAKHNVRSAEEFMGRVPIRPGTVVLDVRVEREIWR